MIKNKLNHFKITNSLSDEHINQLVVYSKEDPDVLQFTRDAKRFVTHEATKQFTDEADMYALLDNDMVVGIIWFSSKPLPNKQFTKIFDQNKYDTTFAIRLYGEAKGKGLSLPFMKEAFTRFAEEKEKSMGIWLQTRAENVRAIHLYEKFGFKQISDSDTEGCIIMICF